MANIKLQRGNLSSIQNASLEDGTLSIAKDTKQILLDNNDNRTIVGEANYIKSVTYPAIVDSNGTLSVSAVTTTNDGLMSKEDKTTLDSHTTNTKNPHGVTKAQVGLSNVDNTSDINKPISTATQEALDNKANITDLTSHINDTTKHIPSDGSVGDVLTKTEDGNIEWKLTNLGNIEGTANIKSEPTTEDYVPIIDSADSNQMKKTTVNALINVIPTVSVDKGGTGATTAESARENLGAFSSSGGTIDGNVNITGNLQLKGSGNYGNVLSFGDGDGDRVHISEPTDDDLEIKANNINFVVSGDVTKNNAALALASHTHSFSDITGDTLPISTGGTGATTAESARENLGAFSSSGGTVNGDVAITGNLRLEKSDSSHGNVLNFGDGDNVHISEPTDDNLEIKANNINFVVSGDITKNNVAFAMESHTHSFSDITGDALPISTGGTGATTADEALANIGAAAASDLTSHTDDAAIHVTEEDRTTWNDKAAKPKYVSVELSASYWEGEGPYTQTVDVSGVTATNMVIAAPAPASWDDAGKAMVCCSAQAADSLTFTCKKMPTVDLTYNVSIQEVG